jgi:hypothetical protein
MTSLYLLDKIKKRFRRWDRKLTISKRQQFVVATLLLTTGLVFTYIAPSEFRFILVGLLALSSGVISAFVLRQDLKGAEWFTLLILPMLFSLAVGLFYFLLPVRWLTRLPVALLFGIPPIHHIAKIECRGLIHSERNPEHEPGHGFGVGKCAPRCRLVATLPGEQIPPFCTCRRPWRRCVS